MATQIENGRWRTQVLVSEPGEKRRYKSFYGDTEDEADYLALEYKLGKKKQSESANIKLGKAIDDYIDLRRPTLSPSTIRGYKIMRGVIPEKLMGMRLSEISYIDVQRAVNEICKERAIKTAKNAVGLISATMAVYCRENHISGVSYPKEKPKEYATPDGERLKAIFCAVEGTNVEVPVLLASWLSLRMSEVLGLKWDDVRDGYIYVNEARVTGEYGIASKSTKTEKSTRKIPLPGVIAEKIKLLPKKGDYVFEGETEHSLRMRFQRRIRKAGIEPCRFHDLRHANASIMLMLGIPDKYAMERGGWSTTSVLKGVYQQTFTEEQKAVAERINSYFETLLQREMQQ